MSLHVNAPSATITTSTTTARTAYPATNNQFVRVFNEGTTTAYFKTGDSTVTATAGGGTFLGGGKSAIFQKGLNDTHLAAILVSGTGVVYFQDVSTDELVGF